MRTLSLKFLVILLIVGFYFSACEPFEQIPEPGNEYELTVDTSDYITGIVEVAEFYNSNPIAYFAEFGLVSVVHQAGMIEEFGGDPLDAFNMMLDFFDENQLQQAIEQQQIPQEFLQRMQEEQQFDLAQQWVYAIRWFGEELGELLINGETAENSPRVGQLYMFLGEGINYALNPQFFEEVAPDDNINVSHQDTPDEFCTCEMGGIYPEAVSCDDKPNQGADDNAVVKKEWKDVRNPYNTTCNGSCATLATGLCLNKLKQIGKQVDGKTWQDISKKIKAVKKGGAYQSEIKKYYESLGYSVKKLSGSNAIKEANAALARGCNVKIVYHDRSWIGGQQHVEFVTGTIKIDPNNPNKATVPTHSWGDAATVMYENGTFTGTFSGKSDGASYGNKHFLNKTGNAWFVTYCKSSK